MTNQTSYQRLIGWVFMVMFLFITTPVQLWHHHPPVHDNYAENTIHTVTPSVHGHCEFCEHQYTVFWYERADWQPLTPLPFSVSFATPVLVFPHITSGQDANKGPPATA